MEGGNEKEQVSLPKETNKIALNHSKVMIVSFSAAIILIVILLVGFLISSKSGTEIVEEVNTVETAEEETVLSDAEKVQQFIDSQRSAPATAEEKAAVQDLIDESTVSYTEEEMQKKREEDKNAVQAFIDSTKKESEVEDPE